MTNGHISALVNLANTSTIRVLSLDRNPGVTDSLYANLIGEDSTLKTLSLRGNKIGDNGAKALTNALKVNRFLCGLVLWDNNITRDGAEAFAEVYL